MTPIRISTKHCLNNATKYYYLNLYQSKQNKKFCLLSSMNQFMRNITELTIIGI